MCRQDDPEVQEATADMLMGEQTWPTEEELAAAAGGDGMDDGAGRSRRNLKPNVIPAGMSSYQADWLVDDEGNLAEDGEGDGEDSDMEGEVTDEDDDVMESHWA